MAMLATVDQIGFFVSAYYFVIVSLLILVVCVASYICDERIPLHKVYFCLVIIFGVLFCAVLPPYSAPDEEYHINQAFSFASSITDKLSVTPDTASNAYLLTNTDTVLQKQDTTVFTWRAFINDIRCRCGGDINYNPHVDVQVDRNRQLYVVSGIGVAIGIVLHLNFAMTLMLGRLLNLLIYALFTGYAVKKAPFGNKIFAAIGMLPICLQQAASFSYDCLTLSFAFSFTALCLNLACGLHEKIKLKQIIPVAILGILLVPSKVVYFPLGLLIFLIPSKRLKYGMKAKTALFMLFVVAFLISGARSAVQTLFEKTSEEATASSAEQYNEANEELSIEDKYREMDKICYSLDYILAYPGQTIQLVARSIMKLGDHYLKTMVGGSLSYFSVDISWIWVVLLYLILSWVTIPEDGELSWNGSLSQIWAGLVALGCFALVVLGFVTVTPTYYTTIYGLQGRYFLPALPLMLLVLRPSKIHSQRKDNLFCAVLALVNMGVLINAYLVILAR